MLHWGLGLVAVLIPVQIFFGHLTGVVRAQAPAGEVRGHRGALADAAAGERGADRHSRCGASATCSRSKSRSSAASSRRATGPRKRSGWRRFPQEDRPPVLIPFFAFRLMVGMGLIMLAVSWFGNFAALARPARDDALVPVGGVPVVSDRLHRRARRLVHGRGRAPALGGLWPAAHQGRGDAVAHDRRRAVLAGRLRAGLCRVYSFGTVLHLRLLREGPTEKRGRSRRHRQPADGVRRSAGRRPARRRRHERRRAHRAGAVLGRRDRAVDPGLRDAGRLRSRRRHPVRHDAG